MSNPSGGQQGHERISARQYVENVKHRIQEAEQYRPGIHEQLSRQFEEFQPPLYARLRGRDRLDYLQAAEKTALVLAAAAKRAPTESETTAVAELSSQRMDNFALWKWTMTGVAGYFTWRGADRLSLPFIKKFNVGFRGMTAANSPRLRAAVHLARFVAYYATTWVLADPLYLVLDHRWSMGALNSDDRLRVLQSAPTFMDDFEKGQIAHDAAQYQASPERQPSAPSYAGASSSPSAWSRQSTSAPVSTTTSTTPQETGSWSNYSENDDLGSDTQSAQANASANSGSAWDRIRRQTMPQSTQVRQQSQSSWGSSQSSGSWDAQGDGAQNSEKDEAQRQFDELLEKERQGAEPESKRWSRR